MKYNNPSEKNSTIATQVMCAVLFVSFSFCWLYWFQADVLAVAQHVLSDGYTHYNRTVGACLITLSLWVLQRVVFLFTRLRYRTHALTYLPSMLALAVVSDISSEIDLHFSMGAWYWVLPLVLCVWGGVIWMAKQSFSFDVDKVTSSLFSRCVWINMLQLFFMMLAVAMIGNTNAVFHYRAHAEVALMENRVDEALRVGEESLETDENLTMLRIYALSKKHLLGECLFRYPISGTASDMLPVRDSRSRLMLFPSDSIWVHLGARPAATMNVKRYLKAMEHDTLATSAVADYVLCGHLINRDIDAFVRDLPIHYAISDSTMEILPRHYREALTLYTHLRSNPKLVYHNAVMDEDWNNLLELEKGYKEQSERKGMVAERYSGSYWYYYFYK